MNKHMKFAFVTRTLTGGGAERFVATFSSYLADLGYDVHIISFEKSENDYELGEKVNLMYLPNRKENLVRKIFRVIDLKKYFEKIKPDIIIPFINSVMFCSWIAAYCTNAKLIYTVRVSPWHRGGTKVTNAMENIVAKYADAIMVQTKEQGVYFKEYDYKTYTVPNPVNEKFSNTKKEMYSERIESIVMVGRLEKQKNYEMALLCMSELKKKYPYLKMEIYGEGAERSNLTALIKQYDLENCCHLMGRCNHLERILPFKDLYLMTSNYEGMPNSLMEALAIGLPCISSDCKTGPKDLIDQRKTGMLFRTGDIQSLLSIAKEVIDNPKMSKQMGIYARNKMRNEYSLNNTYRAFIDMCSNIMLQDNRKIENE